MALVSATVSEVGLLLVVMVMVKWLLPLWC
jgi:hypothetical protein